MHQPADCLLIRETNGAYDASTGTPAKVTETYECEVVLTTSNGYTFDENLVQSGDLTAIIAAEVLEVDPMPGDKLVVQEITYAVVSVVPSYGGLYPVAFTMLVRK